MKLFRCSLLACLGLLAGCNTVERRIRENPSVFVVLPRATQDRIRQGDAGPGYTPEMVYLALGKPTEVSPPSAEAGRDGVWIYRNRHRNHRDFVRGGFRRRVVFDPERRSDVVITERVDPKQFPELTPHSLYVIFRDGKVVEIQRIDEM